MTRALSLLRANYVFPELAGQAATAVEARLAAGEYDDLDEVTLTERVTGHLQEITGDKRCTCGSAAALDLAAAARAPGPGPTGRNPGI